MKFREQLSFSTFLILINIILSQYSYAHTIVAQHGTLNVIDDGAYMMLSLPVSAFEGIDDNKDGKLSDIEFTMHRPKIAEIIHRKIILKDESGKLVLQGMILAPLTHNQLAKTQSSQLIVMGRFTLVNPNSVLQYRVDLFGKTIAESSLKITATRDNDYKKQFVMLSKKRPNASFFDK